MNGSQQRQRDAQAQNPAEHGKHGHVHVVQHEHLIAQHGQAVEILGALHVLDGSDGCLQLRHVGLQGNRDLVAKPPLHARADRAEKPRCRRRYAKRNRRSFHESGTVLQSANHGDEDVLVYAYGAPPEQGGAEFLDSAV